MGAAARERLSASGCLQDARNVGDGGRCAERVPVRRAGLAGNRDSTTTRSNSFLNEVIDEKGSRSRLRSCTSRWRGGPDMRAEGVNFPGHFLVRALQDPHAANPNDGLIVDPFHGGAILNEADCRRLEDRYLGERRGIRAGAAGRGDPRRQVVVRMLLNLKKPVREDAFVPAGAGRHRCAARAAAFVARPTCATAGCSPIT